ncbi:hypothetical protein ND2E_3410 [Colwellia psychrerythraea]|uniref:Uncharacterized protein n=1 Tax=Colwellia psychrerythraea TaxID=28229 RepID=A0A099KMU6_COLPS|nr:hypothetical protein ND2E_3410 [Colwellia psychrerythraea]
MMPPFKKVCILLAINFVEAGKCYEQSRHITDWILPDKH